MSRDSGWQGIWPGRRTWGRGAVGVGCALVLLAPAAPTGPTGAAEGSTVRTTATTDERLRLPEFGAVYHGMWNMTWEGRSRLLDKLERIGARWVRIGVQWSLIQPRRPTANDPGYGLRWAVPKADRVIGMAHRRGFKVSVTFLRTPGWANGGKGPTQLPRDLDAYARAVGWMADRYRDQVQSWEIWNEPNSDNHLRGGRAPRYAELLCQAYRAIHHADRSTRVVFGGTAGNAWGFIARAYEHGAKGCFDVLATHPYNQDKSPRLEPPNDKRWWFKNIRLVRRVMVRHGDAATPVWFTEVGWSTHRNTASTPSWKRGVTREEQARYAAQMLRITAREFPYVKRVCWYSAKNERTGDLENDSFGLYTHRLHAKPVATRIRELLRRHG
jgi:polysaccharide biosynthesis protein PslG